MAPLTESQIAGIHEELLPHICSDEAKTSFGVGAYKAFLGAHPEYIQHFSKLNGLTIDNVFESEGIKYYGRTLVDEIVKMLTAGADDEKLQQLLHDSGKAHTARNIDNAKFMSGLPVFVDYFNRSLTVPENQIAMEAFLNHVFPNISKDL
ncbi:Globin-3 [Clonorchis sinensis]|uniref:Globin-3 n=2 Tax=Clonorchis sinensis TaxID=79923 RepID=A0A8T1M8F1_CLOSI|nr:Globin-3 [Clonorchis sinensis]GAA32735.1 myoglobin [Clonorchis sinensis]